MGCPPSNQILQLQVSEAFVLTNRQFSSSSWAHIKATLANTPYSRVGPCDQSGPLGWTDINFWPSLGNAHEHALLLLPHCPIRHQESGVGPQDWGKVKVLMGRVCSLSHYIKEKYSEDLYKQKHLHLFEQEIKLCCIKVTEILRFLCSYGIA